MSDFIPDEVVIEILKRLPVKSILRFRCVSKSWYSLITNSTFITAHINHNNSNNNSKLIIRHRSDTHLDQLCYSLHHDNDTFDNCAAQLQTPFPDFSRRFRKIGCCNGLICLSSHVAKHISGQTTIILWNPSIRKYFTLPIPCIGSTSTSTSTSTSPPFISWWVLGFGYKPVSDDYMVVRIVYSRLNDGSTVASPEVGLYDLNTGLWRAINVVPTPYTISSRITSTPPPNVEGALHWVASNPTGAGGFQNVIVSFDMVDEVFGEIMLPSCVANEHCANFSVAAFGNLLYLFHNYNQKRIRLCCVWVMKEYGVVDSWSKVCTFDLRQGLKFVLGFRKNGEVLLATAKRELYSYDFKNRKTRNLGICGTTHAPYDLLSCSLYAYAYVESLILLEQADRVLAVEGNHSY